jgi:RNA polymerase sigma factor (sigma-70 family)
MTATRRQPLLEYLRQVLGTPASGGVSDADLLRRFVTERDEAAFELLLWRHAAMVLHVCRQVLRDTEAAEDAFQATFLVFVRKANAISQRESLGGWLYRVAYRIALKARQQIQIRAHREREREAVDRPTDDPDQRELRRLICEEVDRLPAKYRAPIVACYLESWTHEEAAKQLGVPQGTVASRLARGRELLRRRLVRRGVALTTSSLLAVMSVQTAHAAMTASIDSALHTTKAFTSGTAVSPRITALAEGVLKAMHWTCVKIVTFVFLVVGLGGVGVTLWASAKTEAVALRTDAEATPKAIAAVRPVGPWGTIKGQVVWGGGDVPKPIAFTVDKDKEHCLSKGPIFKEEYVVNPKNKGVRWAVVYLIDLKGFDKDVPIHPSLKKIEKPAVEMDQPCCKFEPHLLALREGQKLVVKNSSPIAHNVNVTSIGGPNTNQIVPATTQLTTENLKARPLPLAVRCNIHPWMTGLIFVLKNPYFAVTDADGKFEIKNAPAGEYRVVVWQEGMGWVIGDPKPSKMGKKITIRAAGVTDLGKLLVKPHED